LPLATLGARRKAPTNFKQEMQVETKDKRKSILKVSEPDYPQLERVRQKLLVYKAQNRHKNMLDALEELLDKRS
jgi:hypothetical protein